ncbi:hypothetical protein F8M41_004366 [Gigaspora margarita]|uniref:Uncharacterized protein n=1 Tax=Gigaspora margarita TaxID=4874 RepID=A0A8H4A5G6_GIGMA|nr:hypothetical protein F8M41_004366 [Gigaspora margarita]
MSDETITVTTEGGTSLKINIKQVETVKFKFPKIFKTILDKFPIFNEINVNRGEGLDHEWTLFDDHWQEHDLVLKCLVLIMFSFFFFIIILIAAIIVYTFFIYFRFRRIIGQSIISATIAIFTFYLTISFNETFDKFKLASYLLYMGAAAQFLISNNLTYLLLSFLSSYCLFIYGIMNFNVVDFRSLVEQHNSYLSFLFITIFFSQLLNIIFFTAPICLFVGVNSIHQIDIIEELSKFPSVFKHVIIIFLSRGLSSSEGEMIANYNFANRFKKLYFWLDEDLGKFSNANHVSFDLNSFYFFENLKNERKYGNDEKLCANYFKYNYHIFNLMLFIDFN